MITPTCNCCGAPLHEQAKRAQEARTKWVSQYLHTEIHLHEHNDMPRGLRFVHWKQNRGPTWKGVPYKLPGAVGTPDEQAPPSEYHTFKLQAWLAATQSWIDLAEVSEVPEFPDAIGWQYAVRESCYHSAAGRIVAHGDDVEFGDQGLLNYTVGDCTKTAWDAFCADMQRVYQRIHDTELALQQYLRNELAKDKDGKSNKDSKPGHPDA